MARATFAYVLGMGGLALDPGGAYTIRQRAIQMFTKLPLHPGNFRNNVAMIPDVNVPELFREEAIGFGGDADVVHYLAGRPHDEAILLAADSCGANKLSYVAAQMKLLHRTVAYMALIQASTWCNANWIPKIGDNVKEYLNIYASAILTLGLGNFKPQPADWGNNQPRYPGTFIVNGGKTIARYVFVNDVHPGDTDVTRVQNPILSDVKRIIAALPGTAAPDKR